MAFTTILTERLGLRHPIIQAPLAGGGDTPELIAAVEAVRAARNGSRVTNALADLRGAARTDVNLVPVLVEAVKSYATIGKICDVLRDVFGVYQAVQVY